MNAPDSDAFARRLRLLVAREFAARGYYLDTEELFEGVRNELLTAEELELLANVAALRKDWPAARKRFDSLAGKCGDAEKRTLAQEMAAFASEQKPAPPLPAAPLSAVKGRCRRTIIVAAMVGAALAILALWAAGMVVPPKH